MQDHMKMSTNRINKWNKPFPIVLRFFQAWYLAISVETYVKLPKTHFVTLFLKDPALYFLANSMHFRPRPRNSLAPNPPVIRQMVIFTLLLLYRSVKTIRVRRFLLLFPVFGKARGTFLMQYPVLQIQQGTDTR